MKNAHHSWVAKVGNLVFPASRQQDVGKFKIQVNYILRMEVCQTRAKVVHHSEYFFLCHVLVILIQGTFTQFHLNVQLSLFMPPSIIPYNVRTFCWQAKCRQGYHFLKSVILLTRAGVWVGMIIYLDCIVDSVQLVDHMHNLLRCSFS